MLFLKKYISFPLLALLAVLPFLFSCQGGRNFFMGGAKLVLSYPERTYTLEGTEIPFSELPSYAAPYIINDSLLILFVYYKF